MTTDEALTSLQRQNDVIIALLWPILWTQERRACWSPSLSDLWNQSLRDKKTKVLFFALPSAAGGRLTRHPCQGAVRQLGGCCTVTTQNKADGDFRLLWSNLSLP
jgi:hypothetical protein